MSLLETNSKVPVTGKGTSLSAWKMDVTNWSQMSTICPTWKSTFWVWGQFLEKGYDIHMKDYSLFIRNDKVNLITKIKMSKNLMFSLNIQKDV